MPIGEICSRDVVFVEKDSSVKKAAELMREYHVGDLIVVEPGDPRRVPAGIITDRDIVVEVLAEDVNPEQVDVGDVMSFELASVQDDSDILETIRLMRTHAVRRIPVVDEQGGLTGIVSLDDLIELLAENLTDLTRVVTRQQEREKVARA